MLKKGEAILRRQVGAVVLPREVDDELLGGNGCTRFREGERGRRARVAADPLFEGSPIRPLNALIELPQISER
jgi:hypothetical protein